jgi:hypothetical protein
VAPISSLVADSIKNDQAVHSAAERAAMKAWYESTRYPRLEPGGAVVIVQTRWHCDDLCGWLLSEHPEENWEVLSLPAIAETDEGWRGERDALWPERFPTTVLAGIRAQLGGPAWQSLYMQRPTAATGDIFQRDWWRYYTSRDLPTFKRVIISLGTAYKVGQENDYSAVVTVGVAPQGYYVLDVMRERLEFPALRRKVEMLAQRWNPNSILIEDKAPGRV